MIMPSPKANKKRRVKLMGRNSSAHENDPPSTKIIKNNATKERALSIKAADAMLNGNSIFGRYIFLIRPSLLINAAPDCVTTALKKFHGIMAANKESANVRKSALKSVENTTAIIVIISNGFIRVHK